MIVMSIQDSKPYEKQISPTFSYFLINNTLLYHFLANWVAHNETINDKSVFREAWSPELTSQSFPATCAYADAMLCSCEKSISRKKYRFFHWEISVFLYYPGLLQRLQHLIIQFPLYYMLVFAYGRLKTKENFKLLALKVVTVAYERWSLTRGFQCGDLAEKRLVF